MPIVGDDRQNQLLNVFVDAIQWRGRNKYSPGDFDEVVRVAKFVGLSASRMQALEKTQSYGKMSNVMAHELLLQLHYAEKAGVQLNSALVHNLMLDLITEVPLTESDIQLALRAFGSPEKLVSSLAFRVESLKCKP